jgi:ribose 5-phosphate isomerase A
LTDNGNFVLDALFPADRMEPDKLLDLYKELKLLNGVVEVGLFCGIAQVAYFGNAVSSFTIISSTSI